VNPLLPMAQSGSTSSQLAPALLTLQVPEDAVVYLGGRRMMTQGTTRTYQIPVKVASASYNYSVRVELERDGQKLVASSSQAVSSGRNLQLQVSEPVGNSGSLTLIAAK
jgi:uncharacterized protein (TIGR03000 family)